MKKVMIFLLLCTFMLTSMQLVQAQDSYIVDHYDQFSADEEQYYNEKASTFEQQYDLSVMIVNLETTYDDPTDEVHRVYSDECDNNNALIIAYSDAYYSVVPYGSAVSLINDSIWDAYYNGGYTMTQRTDALFAKMQELVGSNHGVEDEDEEVEKGAYFVDDAQLFDANQEQELLTYFENLSNDLGVEVIGVTTNDMNGNDAESYARQYYYDYDYDSDGIIMMIDMEDRSWALVSMGDLRNAFVRDVRDQMSNAFVPYLSGGDYAEAFKQYGADVSTYYQLYENHGAAYYDELDKLYYEQNKGTIFMMGAGGGLLLGLIIAFIVRMSLVKQCKMVEMKPQARDYLIKNSMRMRTSQDYFLYSNVIRTARPRDDERSSSSSSSSFDSGGSSGKF
jgi:uncharacterized protein